MSVFTNILLIILIVMMIAYFALQSLYNYRTYKDNKQIANLEEMYKNVQEDFMHEKQNYQKIIAEQKDQIKKLMMDYNVLYHEYDLKNERIKELEEELGKVY